MHACIHAQSLYSYDNLLALKSWDGSDPVTQVFGEQAFVDILDLSEVAWTCWGNSTPSSGLGLRMVKELDLQLALGMNERRKTVSACV